MSRTSDDCAVGSLGIPGDRGWALRDETTGEITNGKRLPLLMQCAARYREAPENGVIPNVEIRLPEGSVIRSEADDVSTRLSTLLGRPVTLWSLQPAANSEHYRRKTKAARIFGRWGGYRAFRSALPLITRFGSANAELREMFSREPNEVIPDISTLPAELLEFTTRNLLRRISVQLFTTASFDAMARLNPKAAWTCDASVLISDRRHPPGPRPRTAAQPPRQ